MSVVEVPNHARKLAGRAKRLVARYVDLSPIESVVESLGFDSWPHARRVPARRIAGTFEVRTYRAEKALHPAEWLGDRRLKELREAGRDLKQSAAKAYLPLASSVDGWFSLTSAVIIEYLHKLQMELQFRGSVLEIGVHHGKSALFLKILAQEGEHVHFNDLFDIQDLNASKSGKGDERRFLENIDYFFGERDGFTTYRGPSNALRVSDLPSDLRLIHIDGGHAATDALGDLQLAEELSIGRPTVTILDDFFHPAWPGVTEAYFQYFMGQPSGAHRLVPILADRKKIYLCNQASYPKYNRLIGQTLIDYLSHALDGAHPRAVKMMGRSYRVVDR